MLEIFVLWVGERCINLHRIRTTHYDSPLRPPPIRSLTIKEHIFQTFRPEKIQLLNILIRNPRFFGQKRSPISHFQQIKLKDRIKHCYHPYLHFPSPWMVFEITSSTPNVHISLENSTERRITLHIYPTNTRTHTHTPSQHENPRSRHKNAIRSHRLPTLVVVADKSSCKAYRVIFQLEIYQFSTVIVS